MSISLYNIYTYTPKTFNWHHVSVFDKYIYYTYGSKCKIFGCANECRWFTITWDLQVVYMVIDIYIYNTSFHLKLRWIWWFFSKRNLLGPLLFQSQKHFTPKEIIDPNHKFWKLEKPNLELDVTFGNIFPCHAQHNVINLGPITFLNYFHLNTLDSFLWKWCLASRILLCDKTTI
jgi:hypothetical protein